MKDSYRGHDIQAYREESLGGDSLLYYSIFRESDGLECTSGFEDSDESARSMVAMLKTQVDEELASDDPWGEKDP